MMLPGKHNLIMAKVVGSIFSLCFSQEVLFGILQYVQYILCGLTSVLLCIPFTVVFLLTAKSVNLVVPRDYDDHVFHSGYFNYRGAFFK